MSQPRSTRDIPSGTSASAVLSGPAARTLLPAQCPDCGLANAPERKFCSGCGRGLWEACLSCGEMNGAWEKFCGVCGVNLAAIVQERIERFEALLEQASVLRTLCRHGEAIGLLERVEPSEHPRLKPYTTQCQDLAEELKTELVALERAREEHFQQAQQCCQERRYEGAAAALARVHHRMRSPEMQKLLDEIRGILEEIPALAKEIREAVAERRTQGLLPKVERYLELKPDDPPMRELADKLATLQQRQFESRRSQLLSAARNKAAVQDYAGAARLVEQVDPSVLTPEAAKFLDQCRNRAAEIAWLVEDLRDFALFDEHLLPLAERLVKLRPADEGAAKLAARIRRLHEQQEAAPAGKRRRCVPSQKPSPLGWPIDVLEGFRTIDDESIRDCEAYVQHFTSFYVACGLALQGLNKAAMPINLLPDQRKGLWGLTSTMLKKRSKEAWGLDLGASALKAVKLSLDDSGKVRARACEYIPFSPSLIQSAASPEMLVGDALEQLLQRQPMGEEAICVGYPAFKTLARFVSLPSAGAKKLPEMVKYEARQQIPFPLDTVAWDYHFMGPDGDGEPPQQREACLLAVKSDEAAQFLYPLEQAKLKVDLLQAENVALHNFVAFDYFASFQSQLPRDEESPRHQVAVLDIGAASSNLIIGDAHSLWVRNLPIGGQHFNKPLISEFHLTHDKAEQLKRKPPLAAWVSKAWQAMDPVVRDFQAELRRSLASFEHTHRDAKIRQMLLTGGGARLHGLLRLLRQGPSDPGTI